MMSLPEDRDSKMNFTDWSMIERRQWAEPVREDAERGLFFSFHTPPL